MPVAHRDLAGFPRRVELLVFPGVQLLDVAGPLQVFASANDLATDAGSPRPYTLAIVGISDTTVSTSAGLGLQVSSLPATDAELDTLLVPGGRGVPDVEGDPVLLPWISARASRARRVVSVCTGAFLLAAAGVLDERRAVTHWAFCAELAKRYPSVKVEFDPIFVRDGNVWTSAGVSAGVDLALALVEEDLGRAIALAIARYLVVFLKRPGGQAQFSAALALQGPTQPFDPLHAWMADHLSEDLSLPALARRAGMSERSFSRHYVATIGVTPARSVERLRVESARQWLSERRASIKRVAVRCGFGSEETMRRSFLRIVGVTPTEYRARFGT
jgi:transcriptional regulator GlxA family with amidase domain